MRWLLPLCLLALACDTGVEGERFLGKSCQQSEADRLQCPHATRTHRVGVADWSEREVHFQVPAGEAPREGWPVVFFFQGSFVSAGSTWDTRVDDAFGAYHLTESYDALLRAGYAIISPETRLDGHSYWDSNILPYRWDWELSDDHELMLELFAAIDEGEYGAIDSTSLFAMGISSGGYMSSRVALAYPGRFTAIAIHSGSYATCSGPVCSVPESFAAHPPTLFLHGDADNVVPISTAREYAESLERNAVANQFIEDADAGHEWLAGSAEPITNWFQTWRAQSKDTALPTLPARQALESQRP